MSERKLNTKRRIIAFLFFILIGGIVFNSTFFLHTHRTACGKLIVHAHPFNKHAEKDNPSSQHEHNKIDLQVISSIDYYTFSQNSINLDYNPDLETEVLVNLCLYSNSKIHSSYTNRGPPSISFLA
ncbi:MAG: hypothetical protein K8R31_07925 [Bacteroidales bacterium]|nr:hypothetical protein [Bacteroidales bacterium]